MVKLIRNGVELVVSDERAEAMIARGYSRADGSAPETDNAPTDDSLAAGVSLTKKELLAMAKSRGVKVSSRMSLAQLTAALKDTEKAE